MTWNYRLMRHTPKNGIPYCAVHEVYYDDKNQIELFTEKPVQLIGDEAKDILSDLKLIVRDVEKSQADVIDYREASKAVLKRHRAFKNDILRRGSKKVSRSKT